MFPGFRNPDAVWIVLPCEKAYSCVWSWLTLTISHQGGQAAKQGWQQRGAVGNCLLCWFRMRECIEIENRSLLLWFHAHWSSRHMIMSTPWPWGALPLCLAKTGPGIKTRLSTGIFVSALTVSAGQLIVKLATETKPDQRVARLGQCGTVGQDTPSPGARQLWRQAPVSTGD